MLFTWNILFICLLYVFFLVRAGENLIKLCIFQIMTYPNLLERIEFLLIIFYLFFQFNVDHE